MCSSDSERISLISEGMEFSVDFFSSHSKTVDVANGPGKVFTADQTKRFKFWRSPTATPSVFGINATRIPDEDF